ncbi:MAG TPA: dual specificity protein phosphatase 23 [Gemmataceae bacterium]|jgi:atypical dual specificity phosphatase|nr:dual specificity protein phosphatase 23 [Gemmataceae bacterium]
MSQPYNFSWIEPSKLAAMGMPDSIEELEWLRQQGIELVITLTEDPLPRYWLSETGLLGLHVPVEDMSPPSIAQIEECLSAIRRANEKNMGVVLHCFAGKGRTGTILACYFVEKGFSPVDAIAQVRKLRPGSIESFSQGMVVEDFAQTRSNS